MNIPLHFFIDAPYAIFWVPLLLLAIPVGIRRRSYKSFLMAALQVGVGIELPVIWFLMWGALVPDWKGASVLEWVGCFAVGKIWLSPLVVWAACAFYARVVWKAASANSTWIVLGYCSGAVVSNVCFVMALVGQYQMTLWLWPFIVPVGLSGYYTRCAIRLVRENSPSMFTALPTGVANLSFLGMSIWQSMKVYQELPDTAPSCFVVTAAARGHETIVGPHFTIQRAGCQRRVNQQLLTFWALEEAWKSRLPRSHRLFRCLYNQLGPVVARRINRPWLADLTYVALKPLEWVANVVLISRDVSQRK